MCRVFEKEAISWYKKRNKFTHENLLRQLRVNSKDDYGNFLRMDFISFHVLLFIMLTEKQQNIVLRETIPANMRLSPKLSFLATGDKFVDLEVITAISLRSFHLIMIETCEAICTHLSSFIKVMSDKIRMAITKIFKINLTYAIILRFYCKNAICVHTSFRILGDDMEIIKISCTLQTLLLEKVGAGGQFKCMWYLETELIKINFWCKVPTLCRHLFHFQCPSISGNINIFGLQFYLCAL